MAITYTEKTAIAPVGVSQVRVFDGPVDLKIEVSGTAENMEVIDNFPSGLSARNLFGAVVELETADGVCKTCIADRVYTVSNGDVYFSLGSLDLFYDLSEGRAKFVE